METFDLPINVIVLEDIQHQREELVEDYLDILKTCKKYSEFKALVEMIQSDTRTSTLREILVRDIQAKAKVLEETMNNY